MNIALKTNSYLRFPLVVLSLLGSFSLFAQDIHFTQFYNAPLTLSPALTGVSNGDIRIMGLYRSQWNAANAPYKTFQAGADKKFYNPQRESWWMSGGLNVFNDRTGDGNFSTTHIAVSGAYTKMLDKENFLTIGLSAAVAQRRFEFGNFTFDNQWNGEIFDPNRAVNETFDDPSIFYPDFGIGFNWRGQQEKKRSKIDLGAGAFHFNRPNQNFKKGDPSPLPVRLSMYAMPTVQITSVGDVVSYATAQIQEGYFEALAGAAYRHHLSTKKSKEVAVQLGFGYRFNAIGDALTPAAEVHFHDIMVGFSWDVNVSGFSVATNRNGGPEITMRYIIHKVYPLKAFKACPLI